MSSPDGRPPAPRWETLRSGAGPPAGPGWSGSGWAGPAPGGQDQHGYGQYADFSPPSYAVPPSPRVSPAAQVPPTGGAARPGRRRSSGLPWIVGGLLAVVLAAIVLVLGFVVPGSLVQKVLDPSAVADGVHQVLRDSYRVDGVGSVSCPAEQPVQVGTRFDCRAVVGGEEKSVTVTVTDSDGRYEVGQPR